MGAVATPFIPSHNKLQGNKGIVVSTLPFQTLATPLAFHKRLALTLLSLVPSLHYNRQFHLRVRQFHHVSSITSHASFITSHASSISRCSVTSCWPVPIPRVFVSFIPLSPTAHSSLFSVDCYPPSLDCTSSSTDSLLRASRVFCSN